MASIIDIILRLEEKHEAFIRQRRRLAIEGAMRLGYDEASARRQASAVVSEANHLHRAFMREKFGDDYTPKKRYSSV